MPHRSPRPFRLLALLASMTIAVGACGEASTSSEAADEPTPDKTGIAPRIDTEVDGARVVTQSWVDPLPQRATVVRFTTTLIDDGDGFAACLGGVNTSMPPQCGGPIVDGLEAGRWSSTEAGVTWGEREVTVAWPAVDGRLQLVAADDPADGSRAQDYDTTALRTGVPASCEGIEVWLDVETLSAYAEAHPELTDVLRSVEGSAERAALGVVREHLDEVRADLSTGEAEPCLEEVDYSMAELGTAQDALSDAGLYAAGVVTGSGSGNALNRLVVDVAVADRHSITQVLDAVVDAGGEPGMVVVVGSAEILE